MLNLSVIFTFFSIVMIEEDVRFAVHSESPIETAPAPPDFAYVVMLSEKPVLSVILISPKSAVMTEPFLILIYVSLSRTFTALMPATSNNPPP